VSSVDDARMLRKQDAATDWRGHWAVWQDLAKNPEWNQSSLYTGEPGTLALWITNTKGSDEVLGAAWSIFILRRHLGDVYIY